MAIRIGIRRSSSVFSIRPAGRSNIFKIVTAEGRLSISGHPNVAKDGGLQSQDVKGEVEVFYFEPLTTQNLKSSSLPDVLGRSSKSEAQRVKTWQNQSHPSNSIFAISRKWYSFPFLFIISVYHSIFAILFMLLRGLFRPR